MAAPSLQESVTLTLFRAAREQGEDSDAQEHDAASTNQFVELVADIGSIFIIFCTSNY